MNNKKLKNLHSDYYDHHGDIRFRAFVADQLGEFGSSLVVKQADWDKLNSYAQTHKWKVISRRLDAENLKITCVHYQIADNIFCNADLRYYGTNPRLTFYYPDSMEESFLEIVQPEQFVYETTETEIHLLTADGGGHDFNAFKIKQPDVDLEAHYNDGMIMFNSKMLDRCSNNESGIVLLHGVPGTGKTTFIKNLASLTRRKFMFVTPGMASWIGSSDFNGIMKDHTDSVLVIEDAENVLGNRGVHRTAATSNLLNITDGILSDCFNILVICTFNTSLNEIDNALLRPGRLKAEHLFTELAAEKVKALTNGQHNKAMTISEVFNAVNGENLEKKRVGF